MNRALFPLFVWLLAACTPPPLFPPGTGAVVDIRLINEAACGRLRPLDQATSWTPSTEVIANLESALHERLVRELARDSELYGVVTPTPGQYYRRYAGAAEQGQQIVVIFSEPKWLYDESGQDWRTTTILYRDGGSSSFGAYYDPAVDTITYFEFGFVA